MKLFIFWVKDTETGIVIRLLSQEAFTSWGSSFPMLNLLYRKERKSEELAYAVVEEMMRNNNYKPI